MKRYIVLLLLLPLLAFPALASYISLQTSVSSRYEHGRLTVTLAALNKGDESAYNVQWELRLGNLRVLGDKIPELPVGATMRAEKTLPFKPALPGTYPLAVITHYTDANQYPFSALSLQTFVYRDAGYPPLVARLGSVTFDQHGELVYKMRNSGQAVIKTQTALIVPAELTAEKMAHDSVVEPGSEQDWSFSLKNFSALAGSAYQVFAATEFAQSGFHYTVISPGLVKIVARQQLLGLDYSVYIIALAVLLALFVGAQFLRKR